MIEHINIEGFRCFEKLRVEGFNRVNLIGGRNNAGKTAFLEAIYLMMNPTVNIIHFLNVYRQGTYQFFAALPEHMWDNYFYNYAMNKIDILSDKRKISICVDKENNLKNLKLTYFEGVSKGELFSSPKTEVIPNQVPFKYFEELMYPISNTHLIISSFRISNYRLASEYDQADLKGKVGEVLKAVQIIDPTIIELKTLSLGEPTVYLRREGGRLMPITLFGDSINRVVYIILTLINSNIKTLLIDEIENGIHYTNHREFWEMLFKLAKYLDVQVFATTHSLEMLKTFSDVSLMEENSEEGAYFEFIRQAKTDRIKVLKHDLETLDYELKSGEGVRGE